MTTGPLILWRMARLTLLPAGEDMETKQNGLELRPWRVRQGRRPWRVTGVILAFFIAAFSSLPAHGVGPYTAGDDTVVDQGTGLEWQKSDDATPRNWQDALDYCEDLSLHSQTDWRLPNIRELKSIVDVSRYYPAMDQTFHCRLSSYWSATTVADQHPAGNAWNVFFANGDDNWDAKDKSHYVRCVRGGL